MAVADVLGVLSPSALKASGRAGQMVSPPTRRWSPARMTIASVAAGEARGVRGEGGEERHTQIRKSAPICVLQIARSFSLNCTP